MRILGQVGLRSGGAQGGGSEVVPALVVLASCQPTISLPTRQQQRDLTLSLSGLANYLLRNGNQKSVTFEIDFEDGEELEKYVKKSHFPLLLSTEQSL